MNLIEELQAEESRVRQIMPFLDSLLRVEANRAIVFAHQNVAMNSTEGMKDALEQLKLFRRVGSA